MAILRPFAIALLAGVVVTAHFALGKQAEWTGLFSLPDILEYKDRILPGTDIPIKLPSTGSAAVDNYFAFMASFFWGSLDPRNVRAHVQGNYLLGTLSSIWIIMLAEGHRDSRSARFLFTTYLLEFFGELLGIGLFTPIWCIVHLLWTSAPTTRNKRDLRSSLTVQKNSITALGLAIVFGHVAPTFLLLQCKPDGEGLAAQPFWSVARLFHPILVFGFWKIFEVFGSSSIKDDQVIPHLSNSRKLYAFSILASGFFHASSLAFLLARFLSPGWLRDDVAAALDLKTVVVPSPFWRDTTYSPASPIPFDLGVAVFLQWDNLCSATAIVIWATSLYLEAGTVPTNRKTSHISTTLQTLGVAVLAGPAAGAAYLLQERDALLLEAYSELESRGKQ